MPLKTIYANMDGSVRQEMVLCSWNQIYTTDCWQELHFECSCQNVNRNVKSPSMVMTHHSAKANLDKGFSWPLEAIPYGVQLRVDY